MTEKIKQYVILTRLNKPIGILLLLWPTLWALWLAGAGSPDLFIVGIFVAGVILMRSAGCIVNDIADRKMDGFVERTRYRPIAAKQITTKEGLILFAILLLCAFLLALMLNKLTLGLAFLGVLFAAFYPFMKRFTYLPQVGLGIAFSWGIPMAFAAQTNSISWQGWVLFFAATLWPIIYDTFYAMTDRLDDIKIGIKSTAILFGQFDKIIIGLLQIVFLLLLVLVGFSFHLKLFYYIGLLFVALLFIYQQILIRRRQPDKCFKAFLNNNWVGCVIFLAIILGQV